MKELIIATKNQGKLREIKELLSDFPINVTSLSDYPDAPEIVEDGQTFAANALKKATTIAALYTDILIMGEDSGLEVQYLKGAPGIYSARFAGECATDEGNNAKLIESLKGVPPDQRQARYRCFAALVEGGKTLDVVDGICEGLITTEPLGHNGFGYDPYFLVKEYGKTFGQLDPQIKAKISHRAQALSKIKTTLQSYLNR